MWSCGVLHSFFHGDFFSPWWGEVCEFTCLDGCKGQSKWLLIYTVPYTYNWALLEYFTWTYSSLHSMCWQKFTAHVFWNICLTCFHCSYSVHLASLPCIHLCLVKLEEWGQRLHWECATSIYIQEKKCREKTWARFSYLHADFEKLWKEMFLFLLLEYLGWVQRKLIPFCVPHGV